MGPKVADELVRLGARPEALSVLPVATEVWDDAGQEESRRRLGVPPDATVILCVSRLTGPRADGRPYKTEYVLALLEAFARVEIPAALLIVVGGGRGLARVEERIGELGLDGRVRLEGAVSHDEVRWFYGACDFFAYPVLRDQPYIAILEAQMSGRPVVTTRRRATAELVDDGRTGLLARDLDQFDEYLAKLAGDRELCAEMGRRAREYVLESHTIDVRLRQYEDLALSSS
jgi:phosphatidylinositol alpha-1,6-mannosyltransferase